MGPPRPKHDPVDPEDRKIITLATSARARTQAPQGACLRDTDGRTYAGSTVDLPGLSLTAVQVVVAMAASSGVVTVEAVGRIEAVAVAGDRPAAFGDRTLLADLGCPVLWSASARGDALGSESL